MKREEDNLFDVMERQTKILQYNIEPQLSDIINKTILSTIENCCTDNAAMTR